MIPFTVKLAAQMANARDEIAKLTAERDALLAAQMTEEKAREVLGARKPRPIKETGDYSGGIADDEGYTEYPHDGCYWDRVNICGEQFTALQLKAIAWWMENKGERR